MWDSSCFFSVSDATARRLLNFIAQSEAACGCHRQLSFIKFEATVVVVLTSGSMPSTCILQTSPLVLSEVEYLNGCFFLSQ